MRLVAETGPERRLRPAGSGLVCREGAPQPHDPAERLGPDPDGVAEETSQLPVAQAEAAKLAGP